MTDARKAHWYGPPLVALGALLWATDSLFRSAVVRDYTPLLIVFANHALCLVVTLPLLWVKRRELLSMTRRELLALAFISTFGSVIAMVLFTEAFRFASSYTTPILVQKLQPIFAIGLARVVLGERPSRRYPVWAALALIGAYFVTFGTSNPMGALASGDIYPAICAAGAAAIWGATTVAGRLLLGGRDHLFVTAARFTFASVFIALLIVEFDDFFQIIPAFTQHLAPFAGMAFVSGLLPLVLYYLGLKSTPASTATLCELAFPLAAILLNWILLGQALTVPSLVGAALLVSAITALSYENAAKGKE
jgi:drug/metabolite transporter (DMT)-like permease